MAFTGRDILEKAQTLLNDSDAVRWPLSELAGWINEGVRAICLAKPSAKSTTQTLDLVAGTLQTIPEAALALLAIRRNITNTEAVSAGGRVVTRTSITELNAEEPNWHVSASVPFSATVRQFAFDEENPRAFYVYPGNTGTGHVEAVLSVLPTALDTDGDALADYETAVGLPEPYSVPLLDYVMFRAHSKDDEGAEGGRGMAHYQMFAAALGIRVQVAKATSPNARP